MSKESLIHQRNVVLQGIYKRVLHSNVNTNLITNDTLVSIIIEQPAPRFYIGPYQAEILISKYYKQGEAFLSSVWKLKREMIIDLVENYEKLQKQFPHSPKDRLYEMVVEQPAKSFYMSHRAVRDVIFNYKGRYGKSK